jgi:hypothetical protein
MKPFPNFKTYSEVRRVVWQTWQDSALPTGRHTQRPGQAFCNAYDVPAILVDKLWLLESYEQVASAINEWIIANQANSPTS